MKTMRAAVCSIAMLAAAAPAMAGDLLFQKDQGEEILSSFDGRPWWQMQAYCAGYHGATANYWAERGEAAKARASEAAGVDALNSAVSQLMRDRRIDNAAATKLAEETVVVGGRTTAQALRAGGTVSNGRWNYWRSFCIDAKAAYIRAAR